MSSPRKPTPNEALLGLVEQAEDDAELERVLAMSDEEIDRDLVAKGFDLAKVEADTQALRKRLLARLEPAQKQANGAPPQKRVKAPRGRFAPGGWAWPAAAAVILALFVVAEREPIARYFSGEQPVAHGPDPRERAGRLRAEALRACDEKLWDQCAGLLDQADAMDPASKADPLAQRAREEIARARQDASPPGSP